MFWKSIFDRLTVLTFWETYVADGNIGISSNEK